MISAGRGTRLVRSLEKRGFVIIHEVNLGGRGGSVKFLELTEKGYAAISIQPKPTIGRGASFEHGFWQHYISEELKLIDGARSIIEGKLNEKSIDILLLIGNVKMAIEIAMTDAHEKENIEKDLNGGATKIIIGCKDKQILEGVKKIIETLDGNISKKITVCLVQKVVSEVKNYLEHRRNDG